MKILFVTPETPTTGGGGIATYIGHARRAFEASGHQVFTFSWVFREDHRQLIRSRSTETDRVVVVSGTEVWRRYPDGPFQVAFAYKILPQIVNFVEEIRPDLIETTDFKAPMYAYLAERRAGRLRRLECIPVIGFNHGLTRLLYSTNGVIPRPDVQPELAAERQALRWCDHVFVPSHAALKSLEHQAGHLPSTTVVSEPFGWALGAVPTYRPSENLYHLGRVSFSKGIDHEVHFLNVLSGIRPINRVTFVGAHDQLPFREVEVKKYVVRRLAPSLASRVVFLGEQAQTAFASIFANGGASMNFSNQETFNYACIEMLARGLFPFVKAGTPMAEFLPPDLQHLALPVDFDLRGLPGIVEEVERHGDEHYGRIVEHVGQLTSPQRYVRHYEHFLDTSKARSETKQPQRPKTYKGTDVTILMATYNNAVLIKESIAAIRSQTVAPKEIVIVDDGSSQPDAGASLDWAESLPGVRVVRSARNEGLSATRVKLLAESNTELSVFVDSDDLIDADYLKQTLAAMNRNTVGADAVVTWRQNFGASDELVIMDLSGDHVHYFRNDFRMTALLRTEVLREIGFRSSMRNGEADDWVFWLEFARRGHKCVMVGEPLFLYRFEVGTMSWPWSEGQGVLTAVDISESLARSCSDAPGQAIEDLMTERVWQALQGVGSTHGEPAAKLSLHCTRGQTECEYRAPEPFDYCSA